MKKLNILLLAGGLQALPFAAHAAASVPPAGTYNALIYVLSASVNGAGACNDQAGAYYTSTFYYPGPAKKGAADFRPISATTLFYTQETSFPVTPAAGVTTWTGTFKTVYQPGAISATGTFTSNTVYADAHTFLVTSTIVYPTFAGGTCTAKLQINYIQNKQI